MSTSLTASIPWLHQEWPAPANPQSATLFLTTLQQQWDEDNRNLAIFQNPHFISLIQAIGGNSPYLSDLILKNISFLEFLLYHGLDAACENSFHQLQAFSIQETRANIAEILRKTKQKIALTCAIADIGNLWSLEKITLTLSNLAEATLNLAVSHLLFHAHQQNWLPLPNPDKPQENSGFIILGMGKLGGKELNYSSDIDLIILYDPHLYPPHLNLGTIFTRMTRHLISLMEDHDENGYVFRVDLRLRPDPASSPLAVSLPAAISYYESLGQTWERNAMSKARPVAGDMAAGYAFLEAIRPFIWRKHLDFAIIDDIHSMKNRIDCHKNIGKQELSTFPEKPDPLSMLQWMMGQNVKLGQGGIREIEFLPQTMQLIWGGRFPELRNPQTVNALKQLNEKGLLPQKTVDILIKAYEFLRKTEHRLQMQQDYQTHSLPDTVENFRNFTVFMGFQEMEPFIETLFPLMQDVRHIFEDFFITPESEDNYILDLTSEKLKTYLTTKGFPEPADAAKAALILQGWSENGPRTLRTSRAKTILGNILPDLLRNFSQQKNPLLILQRFDTLLTRHQASVQLLSLFERNPALIERLTFIIGSSDFMAEYLANNPAAIEALLNMDILKSNTTHLKQTIWHHLKNNPSLETSLPIIHNLIQSEEFRLSVAYIENRISLNKSQISRTKMANIILDALLQKVTENHQKKYGIVSGGGMSIVILGKTGSWEMTSGSDLDMMLIFDHPEEIQSVTSPSSDSSIASTTKPLVVNQYYLRLAQSFIAALTHTSYTGALYEIDMRLRPSGKKGPVAVSLASFQTYHQKEAWTWERMALTRARVIGGPIELQQRIRNTIQDILTTAPANHTDQEVLKDTAAMRQKLEQEMPPSSLWDIKYLKGGLLEVEFIAQALQLITHDPRTRHPCTRKAFQKLAHYGYLTHNDAKCLIQADYFWRNLLGLLRIFFGKSVPADLSPLLTPMIVNVLNRDVLPETDPTSLSLLPLEEKIRKTSNQVRELFERLIGSVYNQENTVKKPETDFTGN